MRASDVRKLPWTRYNGEQVQIRSSKTGKLVWIPATRELKAYLDDLPRTGALVMLTPTGKAYAKRYFNEHWREDADKVGAGDLNFHDNRGTAATLLAESGATAPEIAEAMTHVDGRQGAKAHRQILSAPWRVGGERFTRSLRTTGTSTARPPANRASARNSSFPGVGGLYSLRSIS